MSKNKTDDFFSRFGNRVEKVGRDGIMRLMKSTGFKLTIWGKIILEIKIILLQ